MLHALTFMILQGVGLIMASSLTISLDALKCDICLEDMTEKRPKAMECLHTFCETCLIGLPTIETRFLKCPTCNTFTRLSKNGVSALKDNYNKYWK